LKVTHPCPRGSSTIFVVVHNRSYALRVGHSPERLAKRYGMGTITLVCGIPVAAPATTTTTRAPPPTTTTTQAPQVTIVTVPPSPPTTTTTTYCTGSLASDEAAPTLPVSVAELAVSGFAVSPCSDSDGAFYDVTPVGYTGDLSLNGWYRPPSGG
jgi:hypothetical protein